jgi:outer membrane protein TolC
MKNFGTILFVTAAALVGRAAEDARPVQASNSVVITTEFINSLVAEARSNNPALKAADSRVRSATLNAEAVRAWDDPMAIFGGSVYSPQGFKPSEDGNLAYGVEEKLPLWSKPKLNRRVAEAETSTRPLERMQSAKAQR